MVNVYIIYFFINGYVVSLQRLNLYNMLHVNMSSKAYISNNALIEVGERYMLLVRSHAKGLSIALNVYLCIS